MRAGCVPWPKDFADRYRRLGVWRDETIDEAIAAAARRTPGKVAVVANQSRITYAELDARSERLAAGLYDAGLRSGDRIVVQLPNHLEFVMLYLAASRLGVLPIMALPAHREAEIGFFLEHSEAVAYAIAPRYRNFDYAQMARSLKPQHRHLKYVLTSGESIIDEPGFLSIAQLGFHASKRPTFRVDPFDVALFLVSGGTTGLPKLIPRTHADYLYNARAMNEVCEIDASTVLLVAIPVSHNFGLAAPGLMGTLLANGTFVLLDSAAPEDVLGAIERERVTCMPGVPALYINMMERQAIAPRDLSSLKQIIAGGAKFLPTSVGRALEVFGCQVQQVLGMAEGFITATRLGDPNNAILDTVGTPISSHDEYRIVAGDGADTPAGEIGELLVRGPYTIRGYYKAEEHNRRAFTDDGFYRTGDMLERDGAGRLIVAGRVKDMINRGGEKVSAEEVENLVIDHPKLRAAALVPMSDPLMGEKGCLFVMCEEGTTIDLSEIIAHLESKRVARFKFPERLEVIESFPMTAVGKIAKMVLRERIECILTKERGDASPISNPAHSQER
ncbi:MAG TPA: AMP-binding protein [Candidatus Binataceae bacterium]|nr:AMP-binding protein [Candidatus Binataceae bacterium]